MERLSVREPVPAPEDAPGAVRRASGRRPAAPAAPLPELIDGPRDRLVSTPDAGQRIRRSTAPPPTITAPPAGSRIQRASGPVIQRVVKAIQVGKKKKTTKYYTTLDTKENISYFDNREGALALESKLRLAQEKEKAKTTAPVTTTASPVNGSTA